MPGLAELIAQRSEQRHADQAARDKDVRDMLHKQIADEMVRIHETGDPNTSRLKFLQDNLYKLQSPVAKKYSQNSYDVLQRLSSALTGGSSAPQQPDQSTTPSAAPATGGASAGGSAPTPAPTAPLGSDKPINPQGMAAPAAAALAADNQQGANGPVSQAPQQPFSVTDQAKQAQSFRQGPPPAATPDAVASAPATSATDAAAAPAATASAKQSFNQGPPPAQIATAPGTTGSTDIYAGLGDVPAQTLSHQLKLKEQQNSFYEAQARKLGLTNPRDIAEYVGSAGQHLPTFIRPTTPAANHAQLVESMRIANDLPDTEEGIAQAEKLASEQEVRQAQAKGQAAMQVEWFKFPDDKPGDPPHAVRVNPKDPRKMIDASTGQNVPDGASQVNPSIIESQIRQNAYGQFGNLYRSLKGEGYSDADAQKLAGQQVEAEYQKRLQFMGAGNIHEAMGVDANGNAITIPLRTQRVPTGGGPTAAPPTGPSSPAPVPAPGPAAPQAGGGPAQSTPAPKPAPSTQTPAAKNAVRIPASLAPRMLPGVSPATARIAAQYSVPITESVVQLFGDKSKTGVTPLLDFAHLADDEGASQRLGTAINLTRASLGDGIADASVGGGAGGIHVSSGGFGTWIQNKLGVPGAIAGQNATMLRDALKALTPEEREAYDATMSEMSVMAGLRSLSKSSAAISNIHLIENEMAKLGTAASSAQYYDQMQRVGNAIRNAIHTPGLFPQVQDASGQQVSVGISPNLIKQLDNLPSRIAELKKGAGPAKAPPGKSSTLKGKSTEDLFKMLGATK